MARHTRWPAGKDWLPEAFRQLGANTHEYTDPTDEEKAMQWVNSFVIRRISREALLEAIAKGPKPVPLSMEICMYLGNHDMFSDDELREGLRPHIRRIY